MKAKALFVACVVVAMALSGCANRITESEIPHATKINVVRELPCLWFFGSQSTLTFMADNAALDYEKRTLVVRGLKNIQGSSSDLTGWPIREIQITAEKTLVIKIPDDATYSIEIGKRKHVLVAITEGNR